MPIKTTIKKEISNIIKALNTAQSHLPIDFLDYLLRNKDNAFTEADWKKIEKEKNKLCAIQKTIIEALVSVEELQKKDYNYIIFVL